MSVLTDLIYGGSHAVAGLTEGAVNDAIAKFGAEKAIAFPDTAYFFPTIYAATGVKVAKLGDLPACVGVLKSLITDQEDLGEALNAGLATAVGAEIIEGLKYRTAATPMQRYRHRLCARSRHPLAGCPARHGRHPRRGRRARQGRHMPPTWPGRQGLPVQGHPDLPDRRLH